MRRLLAALVAAAFLVLTCGQANAATYGWKWPGTIYVYDATGGNPYLNVPLAVQQWAKSGVDIRLSNVPVTNGISVQIDDTSMTMTQGYAGMAYWTTSGGYAQHAEVYVNYYNSAEGVTHSVVLHELGHAFGLAHNAVDIRNSIMNTTMSRYSYPVRPSAADLKMLAALYR